MNEEWIVFTEEDFTDLINNVDVSPGVVFQGKTVVWVDYDYFRVLIADPDVVIE